MIRSGVIASAATPPAPVVGRRPQQVAPIFTLSLDMQQQVVRAATFGFFELAEAETYVGHLARFIADSHWRFGRAKVLVDRRHTSVQSVAVADRFGRANRELYRPEDRLALVVDSNLAKGQMRRRFVHGGSKAFLSYDAAETWLRSC